MKGVFMSDETATKRYRAPINALKVLNQLRKDAGLPKAGSKPKTVAITAELKLEVTRQELLRLFPNALADAEYEFTEDQARRLVREVEVRLARIKAGKEPTLNLPASSTPPKKRGRKPRAQAAEALS
jgi:hypothetical protein